MNCKKECIFEKSINKFKNLGRNDMYDITGGISVATAFLATFGLVFGNATLLALSPIILLTSFHCNYLMENKI